MEIVSKSIQAASNQKLGKVDKFLDEQGFNGEVDDKLFEYGYYDEFIRKGLE